MQPYTHHRNHRKYDFIDVAKETAGSRNKGQTTRIFTTGDDLDETFWLKYLGEEFRNAVHLQVDDDNNIVPIDNPNKKQHNSQFKTNNIENKKAESEDEREQEQEKRTRFVRQPSDDNKHIPVESLYKRDDQYHYPTEKPEIFNTYSEPQRFYSHNPQHSHNHQLYEYKNNKKSLKNNKKKVLIHNKYKQKIIKVKPPSPLKAIHEPIVVNLLEAEESEHQINNAQLPLVVQMPPVVYHQKADLYPEHINQFPLYNEKLSLYNQEILNSPTNKEKTDYYPENLGNTPANNQANTYQKPLQNYAYNPQQNPQTNTYTPTPNHSPPHLYDTPQTLQHQHQHQTQNDYSVNNRIPEHYPSSYQKHIPTSQFPFRQQSIDPYIRRNASR